MDRRDIEHSFEISDQRAAGSRVRAAERLGPLPRGVGEGTDRGEEPNCWATGVGTRFEATARVAGLRVRSPYDVTGFERGRRFAGQGIAGPVRFSEEYALEPDRETGDRTRLRYAMRAEPRGFFRLARKPIAGRLRRLLDSDLERFKALVETTSPSSEVAR